MSAAGLPLASVQSKEANSLSIVVRNEAAYHFFMAIWAGVCRFHLVFRLLLLLVVPVHSATTDTLSAGQMTVTWNSGSTIVPAPTVTMIVVQMNQSRSRLQHW